MIPLQQIVRRLEAVKVKHGIEPALKEIACEFQAGNIAFQLEPDMSMPSYIPIIFVTYSKEWESRYRDQGYVEIDPVARGLSGSLPFERMNRTLKEATVKRYHYEDHEQLRTHLASFVAAYNLGCRLKTLKGLTPYEFICKT